MHKLQEKTILYGPLGCGHHGKDTEGRIRESYHGRKKFSCVYFWYQLLRTGGLYAFLFRLLGVAHLNGYILISQVYLFKAAVPKVTAWSV